MKMPFLNDSQEKVPAFMYFVWYAFFVAPAIRQASATRNVILQVANNEMGLDLLFVKVFSQGAYEQLQIKSQLLSFVKWFSKLISLKLYKTHQEEMK